MNKLLFFILSFFIASHCFALDGKRELVFIDLTHKENKAFFEHYKMITSILLHAFEQNRIKGYDKDPHSAGIRKSLSVDDYHARIIDTITYSDTVQSGETMETSYSLTYLFPQELSLIALEQTIINNQKQIHYLHIYTNPNYPGTRVKQKSYVISFDFADVQALFKTDRHAVWHNLYNAYYQKYALIGNLFCEDDNYSRSKSLLDELIALAKQKQIKSFRGKKLLSADSLHKILTSVQYDSIPHYQIYPRINAGMIDFYLDTIYKEIRTKPFLSFTLLEYQSQKRKNYLPANEVLLLNTADALLKNKYHASSREPLVFKPETFSPTKTTQDFRTLKFNIPYERFYYLNDSINSVLLTPNKELTRIVLEEVLKKDSVFTSRGTDLYENADFPAHKESRDDILKWLSVYGIKIDSSGQFILPYPEYLEILKVKADIIIDGNFNTWHYQPYAFCFNISPLHPLNDRKILIPLFDIDYNRVLRILANDPRAKTRQGNYSDLFTQNTGLYFTGETSDILKVK